MRMTEFQYIQRIKNLEDAYQKLEEDYNKLWENYLELERYCEELEQGNAENYLP